MTQVQAGGKFVRSGFRLLLLGLVMSFGMVMHYVVGSIYPAGHDFKHTIILWWACPWTLSTSVVLGGALSMVVIGAVHTILGKHGAGAADRTSPAALWLCAFSLIAIFLTGYVGYFVVDAIWPQFYYSPVAQGKNVWLLMQLACMMLYAVGVYLAFRDISRASRTLS